MSVIIQELILLKLVLYVFTRGCEENLVLITVLRDVIPCSLVARYSCVGKTSAANFRIKHGGSTFFETVGTYMPN
jgi:hypothetical protein